MTFQCLLLSLLLLCGEKPKNQAESLKALLSHLDITKGSVIADIGAGRGVDAWVFADIVGPQGRVYAEEIDKEKVDFLEKKAKEKHLEHIRAVLGRDDDPCIPENSANLIYMKRVYHHFSKPRSMLRGIWKALKPGGYLVIVDQRRGTLRDWVSREKRAKKHFFIAETTVVREAREEGFIFVQSAEELWHEKDPFVLIFQRPDAVEKLGGDPDPFLPLDIEKVSQLLIPLKQRYRNPIFIGLGEGRKLIKPLMNATSTSGCDIVLEEWATQKNEKPPRVEGISLPSKLTEKGDPKLDQVSVDAVFFIDTYHLLFHSETLLSKLKESLAQTGCIYVLDRSSEKHLSRREASHRRKIHPDDVVNEM